MRPPLAGPARAAGLDDGRRGPARRGPQPRRRRGAGPGARRPAAVPRCRPGDAARGGDGRQGRRRRHRGAAAAAALRGAPRRSRRASTLPRAMPAADLAERWRRMPGPAAVTAIPDPIAALERAVDRRRGHGRGRLPLSCRRRPGPARGRPGAARPSRRRTHSMPPMSERPPPRAPTRIGPTTFAWGARTYVMGILNVTPDSFSGDGLLAGADPVDARRRDRRADGRRGRRPARHRRRVDPTGPRAGRTRPRRSPGSCRSSRPSPRRCPTSPISIDTTKAAVAEAALGGRCGSAQRRLGHRAGRRRDGRHGRGRPGAARRHAQSRRGPIYSATSSARSWPTCGAAVDRAIAAGVARGRPHRRSGHRLREDRGPQHRRSCAISTRSWRWAGRSCSGRRASRRSGGSSTCPSRNGSRPRWPRPRWASPRASTSCASTTCGRTSGPPGSATPSSAGAGARIRPTRRSGRRHGPGGPSRGRA